MKGKYQQPFENAQIFKDSREILLIVQQITAKMNRAYKYTAGIKTLDSAIDLSVAIADAYSEKNLQIRLGIISQILSTVRKVLILLRTVDSLRLVQQDLYKQAIELCVNVIKQAQAWKSSTVDVLSRQNQNVNNQGISGSDSQRERSERAIISDVSRING